MSALVHARLASRRSVGAAAPARPPVASPRALMHQAHGESGSPLPAAQQLHLRARLGHDFGHVRVHAGPRSALAAEAMGARAYTLGRDIHLGPAAAGLDAPARERLLTHEAIHTVQQGGARIAPGSGIAFGHCGDAAEREAQALSSQRGPARIRQSLAPCVQCDLTDEHKLTDGKFKMGLKTESHAGAMNGMSGTIKFKADAKAPDAASIRLLQIVRVENTAAGTDLTWSGAEADRDKVKTTESKPDGIEPNYFVDHSAAIANPRTARADKAVSPFYRDYWPNARKSQDGSKSGSSVNEASLWDYPSSDRQRRFSFETAAVSADQRYVYGSVQWGFTISDATKGQVDHEYSRGLNVPSTTFDAARAAFDLFYKNPGTRDAPTR